MTNYLQINPSHSAVLCDTKPTEVWADLHIQAPQTSKKRAPIDVAVVLDCSGSMGHGPGSPLAYALAAADYLLSQLEDQDRCAIIGYGDRAHTIHKLSSNHSAGRAAVARMHCLGMTAMSAGIEAGIQQLTVDKHRSQYVFLLSDGHANVGVTDPDGLAAIAARAEGITFSTFGVGDGFNENLMETIAQAGGGGYWFIDSPDSLPQIFGDELSQAFETAFSDLRVEWDLQKGVKLLDVFGAGISDKHGSTIGLMPAGATRHVILKLEVVKSLLARAGNKPLVAATLKGTLAGSGESFSEEIGLAVKATRDEKVFAAGIDASVLAECLQFEAAATQKRAALQADRGDISGAQQLLQKQSLRMRSAGSAVPEAMPLMMASMEQSETVSNSMLNWDGKLSKATKFASYRSLTNREDKKNK